MIGIDPAKPGADKTVYMVATGEFTPEGVPRFRMFERMEGVDGAVSFARSVAARAVVEMLLTFPEKK